MTVARVDTDSLGQIMHKNVVQKAVCIIKFYSNGCHLCHSLQDYYFDIAEQYESDTDVLFFAYNLDDEPKWEKRLKFNGVPTIIAAFPDPNLPWKLANYEVMDEPEPPNKETWYNSKEIGKFIEGAKDEFKK